MDDTTVQSYSVEFWVGGRTIQTCPHCPHCGGKYHLAEEDEPLREENLGSSLNGLQNGYLTGVEVRADGMKLAIKDAKKKLLKNLRRMSSLPDGKKFIIENVVEISVKTGNRYWTVHHSYCLDRHNDDIKIYVDKRNGTLSDCGDTMTDAALSGLDADTPRFQALLDETLGGFGVQQVSGVLEVNCTKSSFPEQRDKLLQAIVAINGSDGLIEKELRAEGS